MSPMFPCVTALYRGLCCHPRSPAHPPLNEKHCDELYWQESLNLLHFRTRCWWIFDGFFFSFRSIYISKLKVDRNLISRLGILLTELNFHWNMIVMEKNRDRVGDDSKSKGKPRARKTTPSWFFNAKRFHNRMARPGFLLFFRGDSSTFFPFFLRIH